MAGAGDLGRRWKVMTRVPPLLLLLVLVACTDTPPKSVPTPTTSGTPTASPSPTTTMPPSPSPSQTASASKLSCFKPKETVATAKPARSSEWRLILTKNTGSTPQSPARHYFAPLGPGRHQPYLERENSDGHLPRIEVSPNGELITRVQRNRIEVATAGAPTSWRLLVTLKKGEVLTGYAWAGDTRSLAYSVGTLNEGDDWPDVKYGYRVWIVNRDGSNRRLIKTVRTRTPFLIAYDQRGGSIYMADGGEAPHTGWYQKLSSGSGRLKAVTGMQDHVDRKGLTFSRDSGGAWWAEEDAVYLLNFSRGAKKATWRPATFVKGKSEIIDMLVAPNQCHATVTVASGPYFNTRTTYLVDLKKGVARELLPQDRFPTQEPKGWSPDSRYLWFEATCDYQCVPRPGAKSEYWILDASTGRLHLFYRSKTFSGDRAETVDWIRFVAWLKAG